MSANTTFVTATVAIPDAEKGHRKFLFGAWLLVLSATAFLVSFGWDYYWLSAAERPFSPKHEILRPAGLLGINLGIAGAIVFCGLFVYALRKHWPWLRKRGNSKHWLDYHVLLGIAGPVLIAFHSSFKFQGIAGFAFWAMIAVSVSGFVGRYLYGQVPRRVSDAEMSLRESRAVQLYLACQLAAQRIIPPADLVPLLAVPERDKILGQPLIASFLHMVWLDVKRPILVARIRRKVMGARVGAYSLGGLLPGKNERVERIIALAKDQAKLSKRIVFLFRAQQIFRLWHIVHKPFSYTFAVLVIVHIVAAMMLGFM